MKCRSTKAGHNVDPARAERLMSDGQARLGFLRLLGGHPLIVWFDGSYEGYGFTRVYWAHEAEATVRKIVERLGEVPDPRLTPNIPPLDPEVWVPTIAYKMLAPTFTPAVRVRIWRDELMSVQSKGDEPMLISIAPVDDATTCDRSERLGTCPNCGSGELQKVVTGYPSFSVVGNPNYYLVGCCPDPRYPSGALVCASCGNVWRKHRGGHAHRTEIS